MLDFRPLASSSLGNAYHVTAGQSSLLIEAGLPYREIQRGVHHQVTRLDGVLISHRHRDHCAGVPLLMSNGVPCYMSKDTAEHLDVAWHHRVHIIEPGQQFKAGTWTVMPFELVHDVPCMGFLVVSAAGERLVYISDTAFSPARFNDVHIFAVEANYDWEIINEQMSRGAIDPFRVARIIRGHMSIQNTIQLLQANDLTKCRAVHLLHLSSGNSNAEEFKSRVQAATGVPVYVAAKRAAP